jgi:tRNA-2-methylthio-N6-dimethylallyladenosine synthase
VEDVLVEGPSKKDASITTGRTRQNKLLHFVADHPLRPGTFVDARVTGAAPHHLKGELVEVTALPRHRTRIPVTAG